MKYIRQKIFIAFSLLVAVSALLAHLHILPAAEPVLGEFDVKLPVLMYHQVLDKPSKLGKFVITPAELEADLRLISDRGFETVTVSDLVAFSRGERNLPRKPIMLTFDDGYQTDYVNVLPLLKKYNMRAVFSVVGAFAEEFSKDVHKHINYAYLSWDEIAEMHRSGHAEFQNHSFDMHSEGARRGALPARGESDFHYDQILREDLELSQNLFQQKVGVMPLAFTYPFGHTNERLHQKLREFGFVATLGTEEKINILTGDPDELYDICRFNRAHNMNIEKILAMAE